MRLSASYKGFPFLLFLYAYLSTLNKLFFSIIGIIFASKDIGIESTLFL